MANQSQKRIKIQNEQKINLYLKLQFVVCLISIWHILKNFSWYEVFRLTIVNAYGIGLLTSLRGSTLDLTMTLGLLGLQFDLLYLGWITTVLALVISNCKT
jgi:hypothetical protein